MTAVREVSPLSVTLYIDYARRDLRLVIKRKPDRAGSVSDVHIS